MPQEYFSSFRGLFLLCRSFPWVLWNADRGSWQGGKTCGEEGVGGIGRGDPLTYRTGALTSVSLALDMMLETCCGSFGAVEILESRRRHGVGSQAGCVRE